MVYSINAVEYEYLVKCYVFIIVEKRMKLLLMMIMYSL